jgi:hypothetical protein
MMQLKTISCHNKKAKYTLILNIFKINKQSNRIEKLESITFKQLGNKEREHLQEWIANYLTCLNEELLIIQKSLIASMKQTSV